MNRIELTYRRQSYLQKQTLHSLQAFSAALDSTWHRTRMPFDKGAGVIRGPALTLADNEHLCVHARFCMRAGGIWNLVDAIRRPGIKGHCNRGGVQLPIGSAGDQGQLKREDYRARSPLSLSNTLLGVSTGLSGCEAASPSNPLMANRTKSVTGSPFAGGKLDMSIKIENEYVLS